MQYKDELRSQGFTVKSEEKFKSANSHTFDVDLYAEKGEDKRIYEFKLIGGRNYQKGQISKFKELAYEIGAEPIVIYVNPPIEKEIVFDDLDELLTSYFCSEGIPSELDVLSTHTTIDSIDVNDIISAEIKQNEIILSGEATINVDLQDGSDSDQERGDGLLSSDSFPMQFTLILDENLNITDAEYKINTHEWYGKE